MKACSKRGDVTKDRGRKAKFLRNVRSQLHDVDLWRSTAAEFLATFIFVFIVCISCMLPLAQNERDPATYPIASKYAFDSNNQIQISVSQALIYATLIQCFEQTSGGYMNPAISVAMAIRRHITLLKTALYSIAQIAGAFSAVALSYGLVPDRSRQLDSIPKIHENVSPIAGFGIEVLQTLILTITWLATYTTSKTHLGSSALPVGIAYLANALWAGSLTGSSMNPARSLATACLASQWSNFWPYVAGPFLGSIIGALLYTYVFETTPKKERQRCVTEVNRNGEGESVQSEMEAAETTSFMRYSQQMSNQSNSYVRQPSKDATMAQVTLQPQQQSISMHPAQGHPKPSLYLTQQTPVVTQYATPQNLQNQPSAPRHMTPAMRTMRYSASTAPNSASVTLSRGNPRPQTRPNTACGALVLRDRRTSGSVDAIAHARSQAATPAAGFRSISASEPFSEGSDILMNNSVL